MFLYSLTVARNLTIQALYKIFSGIDFLLPKDLKRNMSSFFDGIKKILEKNKHIIYTFYINNL